MEYKTFMKMSPEKKREFYNKHRHLGLDHPVMALDENATLMLRDIVDDVINAR